MSILAEKLRRGWQGLLDSVLPQDCLLCGTPASTDLLCTACSEELPRLPELRCPRCALPTARGETCGRCQRHAPHFDRLIASYPYAFPLDRMLQRLKYGHQLALAGWFGQRLDASVAGIEADLIVPMPLHPSRMRERGFNQAIEIARPLARRCGLPLATDICTRPRETSPQEGLTLLQRHRNLKNAFACSVDLSGKRILLIDDVVTTGATVGECARTLRLHGAAEIVVAAVARTLLD